jgi:WD40 repeat protein
MEEKTKEQKIEAKLERELKLPSAVLGFAASSDGSRFYCACLDGGIYEVSAEGKEAPRRLGKHSSYASSVHLLAAEKLLISGGYDGTLQWHDVEKRETIRTVKAHSFWSWQTDLSPDSALIASVTGQYICGGYKYEPAAEKEPSVKVFATKTGELLHSFSHTPPVQSVAFSPDNRLLAAGNLMGLIRVWEVSTGKEMSNWTTPGFTGWGIIKGHYYTGGVFALKFSPNGEDLYAVGMGSTTDPAAGNGFQLWQRFSWRDGKKLGEAREGEIGRGLMETLSFKDDSMFVMAGRLFNGKWNTALFDARTGGVLHTLDTKMRTTRAQFSPDGNQLLLAGTTDQGKKKDGKYPECGRVKIYSIS